MQCPYCGSDSQVVDSRTAADGVRRRRTCNDCKRRFTTYEKVGPPQVKVHKRDGSIEPFEPAKIIRALARIARDRPALGAADIERLARTVEAQLLDERARSIKSGEIVDRLLALLAPVDRLAHDRLATNYVDESGTLRTEPRPEPAPEAGQLGLFEDDE